MVASTPTTNSAGEIDKDLKIASMEKKLKHLEVSDDAEEGNLALFKGS